MRQQGGSLSEIREQPDQGITRRARLFEFLAGVLEPASYGDDEDTDYAGFVLRCHLTIAPEYDDERGW
ncbi:hypothetical protein [Nocardia sp. NPDC020380]|uniref:hypothetical protein n=1 Tax=Nocardia sp. NPDC020380 TaxID=3364309 RepID=UPI0037B80BD7